MVEKLWLKVSRPAAWRKNVTRTQVPVDRTLNFALFHPDEKITSKAELLIFYFCIITTHA